jgi:hypothetical protein
MNAVRVTLTLDQRLLEEARAMSEGNLSRYIAGLLRERLEAVRRQRLGDALREGYLAEAQADLEIAEEYRFVEGESDRTDEA